MPILALPISYYTGLITSEYQLSSNFLAWLTACLQPLDDATTCLQSFQTEFDLDSAQGTQLDVIGTLVGASRILPFSPSGGVSPILDDPTYLIYIKAKIARNTFSGKLDALQRTWQLLFPGGSIVISDHQDMTATVVLSGAFTSVIQDMILNGMIVPRPEGVLYTYDFVTLPIFGYDRSDGFVAGYDLGHWT